MVAMKSVKLTKPHKHAGRVFPAGSVLKVNNTTADWLVAQSVAVFVYSGSTPAANEGPTRAKAKSGCCGGRW